MITEIDQALLEKIADLTGKPVGAFNIRKDSGCEARQSTEHIEITPKADGKEGIDIACGDGQVLRVLELQAPGSRRMAAADYLRGHPLS